ncbi:16S rRNA processing protein RimM [Helicobacter sp. MIT 00-7814]|uniref:ribosome maturation factor RimM n=1 Tax=unclassified Helicobacter TaxID=2593540 RepID=UPI000E1E9EF2|nr:MULTISPECIES: ribosome maturation factor RimM [unclassified Helicobacter]RDU55096.1 16S rRNA processing protein RimM [Helicobacter sp. MIT 99-10781]RDU56915.1 16S rRNA processing protein RimM [Helicobacter sp. MIT 00-7814]
MGKTTKSPLNLPKQADSGRIYIGKLGRSVGVNGMLRVFLQTDFPQFLKQGVVLSTSHPLYPTLEILDFQSAQGSIKTQSHKSESHHNTAPSALITFKNITSKEEASQLTNTLLFSSVDSTRAACELKEGEFFWFDIIGCKIIEEGAELGIVSEIERIGSVDYLIIETSENLLSADSKIKLPKRFLLPYIERYILNTQIEIKSIFTQGAREILEES